MPQVAIRGICRGGKIIPLKMCRITGIWMSSLFSQTDMMKNHVITDRIGSWRKRRLRKITQYGKDKVRGQY